MAITVTARIRRPAAPAIPSGVVVPAAAPLPAPTPPPEPNMRPRVFRRASVRVRIERNRLVLGEISGRLDFETEFESELRQKTGNQAGYLDMKPTDAAANDNPQDGVVDFLLNVTFDTATHQLTERIALGAAPDDRNGLLQMTNPRTGASAQQVIFKDIFGALLVLAPVINTAAAAVDTNSAGDWVALGVSLGVPIAIGTTGVFQTERITLYGGELKLRQNVPPGEELTFTDAGITFDYGVEFGISIAQLNIHTTRPLKVRYKAAGFNLHFQDGVHYQPIFDTTQGYELDLSDPGLFKLPSPLGDLLKILSARIARVNPLTLELELALKVDLGVVSVDSFKVRWPLDPLGTPSITPTGVKVDISNVLIGSGYVHIVEPTPSPGGGTSGGGFDGTADISLVALKLRISASLGVRKLQQGDRKVVAIFAGLTVTFPTPIVLGASGLGIFGLSGLFAMHYKRDEQPPDGSAVSPALRWLIRAQGDPSKLIVNGQAIWVPELDRWSFGLGAIIGTTEGGFIANLRGMLVLELPGPRILVFIKLNVIANLPKLGDGGLDAGLLGVIDLDFARRQLTVGVVADINIAKIIAITLPTELFVKLDNPRKWHMYMGTHRAPASAVVLNLVRAFGYFMIDGDRITDWPGTNPPSTLGGLALAAGLEASITLGSVPARLYLRVASGAHLGVSFSPKLFIAGSIYLEGELRLFIISIEARGDLEAQALVESPTSARTYVNGKICGKVSFRFFKVQGCVGFSIGTPVNDPPPPPLVTNVYLQSHAPVLTAGQGGDRPIDASLGDAVQVGSGSSASLPKVPIDTVPVVQFAASPLVSTTTTFTHALATSPQQTSDGFNSLGGGRQARWRLLDITLDPPLSTALGDAPATWRTPRAPDPQSADTTIDLALMSRVPTVADRALERSTELDALIAVRWGGMCNPIAPATCVLHTFCGQQLGPSGDGWELHGTPWPDPPGTVRTAPAPTLLTVDEPPTTHAGTLLDLALLAAGQGPTAPAEVIGPNEAGGAPVAELTCITFPPRDGTQPNPLVRAGARFEVRDTPTALAAATTFLPLAGRFGLYVSFRTDVIFDAPTGVVELELMATSKPARVTALAADGQQVATATTTSAPGQIGSLRLVAGAAKPIARLRIDGEGDRLYLFRVCFQAAVPVRRTIGRSKPPALSQATGDERVDRLAREFAERRGPREQLARADAAERAAALAAAPPRGLAQFAAPTPHAPTAPAGGDRRCWRALKLPLRSTVAAPKAMDLTDELAEAAGGRPQAQWVVLRTGPFTSVTLLLALATKLLARRGGLLVQQLDAEGGVLDSKPLSQLSTTTVTGVTTGMPPQWLDPAGVWWTHVEPVARFLASAELSGLTRLVVPIVPVDGVDRIRLLVPAAAAAVPPPGVLVGVVQVCPAADAERQFTDEAVRQGQIETMIDYLNGGAVVPLLEPGQTYTLGLHYEYSTRMQGGSPGGTTDVTQTFQFQTDDAAPARLDPWVLGTTPDNQERFHFTADPVKLVFNDLAVIQLFAAYGKQLRFALRTADGVAIPGHEIAALDPVAAGLTTPYKEFLEGMVAAGELPCVGEATADSHGAWTSPEPLRPLMDYTVDVEVDPAPPPPPATAPPQSPFFRRAFTTSRFAGVAELVADVQGRRIRHRALAAPIAGLPATSPVSVASDQALQAALLAAGEKLLPAPDLSGIAVLWAKPAGASAYAPHAILIDAIEPLWRTRQEPALETVPRPETLTADLDPAYKRMVPATVPALRLVESGSSEIARFVHSPGGTRTLAILKDAALGAGRTLTISAERTASVLYDLGAETVTVLALTLGAGAPWETDDA